MQRKLYAWNRFWVPRDGVFAFDAEGFLLPPPQDPTWRKASKTDATSFAEIDGRQCLVLLGEPGIGKSFALRAQSHSPNSVFRNLGTYASEQRLIDEVFGSAEFRRWEEYGGEFRLFLDSFDECLIRLDNVASLLADRFRTLRTVEGLFVRISSRTAEWRIALEEALRQKFADDQIGVYELAPLTRDQVCTALKAEGVNEDGFIREILEREVVSFAIKPLTLDLLLRIWKRRGGSLPPNQTEIYEQGCRELCSESNPERDTPKLRRALTAAQRLDVASHIAAATTFCRRSAILRTERAAVAVETDITTAELIYTVTRPGGASFEIDAPALRETFDTGLFTARGPERLGWAHQTYAEFLAARYLCRQRFSRRQVLDLIEHPTDPERRIVPQLQETAAWVASMNAEVFDRILESEPELLLRSDVATRDDGTKEQLVEAILGRDDTLAWSSDWRKLRARYRKLCHPRIAKQLERNLRSRSIGEAGKIAAADMVESCQLRTLFPLLARVAIDRSASSQLRQTAADIVARLADGKAKGILKPLALERSGAGENEELRGAGLRACWPEHLSAKELFTSIDKPHERVTSRYSMFLNYDLVNGLQDDDLPIALKWVQTQEALHPLGQRGELIAAIMDRAARALNLARVRRPFVAALLKRLGHHDYNGGERAKALNDIFDANPASRHACIDVALKLFADPPHDAFLITRWGLRLAQPEDLEWFLTKLRHEPKSTMRERISHVVARIFYPDDASRIDLVIQASKACDELRERLALWLKPMDLDSEQVAKARASWQEEQKWKRINAERTAPKPVLVPSPAERIRTLLDTSEAGDFDEWWHISHWSEAEDDGTYTEKSDHIDLRTLPGWQNAADADRKRMIAAAQRYLVHHTSTADLWFAKPNVLYRTMTAGLRGLVLLAHEDVASFEALGSEVWERWVPAVARSSHYDETDEFRLLLARAIEVTPLRAIKEILTAVDQDDRKGETLWILYKLGDEIDRQVGTALLARLRRKPALGANCATQLLKACLDAGIRGSIEEVRQWLPKKPPRQKRKRALALEATSLLLLRGDAPDWAAIRDLIGADADFGKIPFSRLSYEHHHVIPPLLTKIAPHEVGDIWEWMLTHYRVAGDPDRARGGTVTTRWAMADFRDALVSSLADRGTADACEELERLRAKYPQFAWFDRVLNRAKEQTRRNTWNPVTPAELFALARERNRRVVQSANQLMEVVRDALDAIQAKLHGETPAAQFLWDLDRPKEEEGVSDWVKIELDALLVSRGVVVNREVQIHIRERTDIHIDAVTHGINGTESRRIKIIIEVKGCWNRDQKRAIETQLVRRYLAQNDCTHGIFLLGWFVCEAWTNADPRRRKVPFASTQDAQAYFAAEAKRLTKPPVRIESIILDATIAVSRRRTATVRRARSRRRRSLQSAP